MHQFHQWVLTIPTGFYIIMGPMFAFLNLFIASFMVNALKIRTLRLQDGSPDNTPTLNVPRTLLGTYLILSGFAVVTLYCLARLPNIDWESISFLNTALGIIGVMLGNDLLYWAYHRLMHTDFFWHRFHYLHHEARSPSELSHTFYEHPLDFCFGTLCAVLPLAIIPINIVAALFCLFLQTFLAIAYHSGHEIYVPGLFNARRHDNHHLHCWGNYAQNFALVDILLGMVISPPSQKLAIGADPDHSGQLSRS